VPSTRAVPKTFCDLSHSGNVDKIENVKLHSLC